MRFIIIPLLILTVSSYAQDAANVHRYLNKKHEAVDSKKEAAFYTTMEKKGDKDLETTFTINGKLYSKQERINNKPNGITEYFYESGKMLRQELFIDGVKEGCATEFYENDSVKSRTCYVDGIVTGRYKKYWPNGRLKRVEDHLDGKQVSGFCYDINGKEIPFEPELKMPQFPGGIEKFYEYVRKNLPLHNISRNGKIVATAWVAPDGSLKTVYIEKSINRLFDGNYADVLKNSPKWIPATFDGEYFPMAVNLPFTVTFD
jgi:antitoxin component YwqK of YwqJK toxin-antitoxin module